MPTPGPNFILPKSYLRLTLGFLGLAGICFGLIWYLSSSKAVIVIHPNTEKINKEYIFDVVSNAESDFNKGIIGGRTIFAEVASEQTFAVTGTKTANVQSDVVGEVTITNNYSKEQALVATTRLASLDDPKKVLVRLKDNVTVPAGGQVKVKVYAEDPVNFAEIAPRKFIIPGLWQPLWEKIYAENSQTLAVGAVMVGVLSEEDIKAAETKIKEELFKQGSEQIVSQLDANLAQWVRLTAAEPLETAVSASAGQEVSEFTYRMKLKVSSIIFDENQAILALKERIKQEAGNDKQVSNLDPNSFNYTLESFDAQTGTAKIKVIFSLDSMMSGTDKIYDKTGLTGKTEKEIIEHFSNFAEVKSVDVSFQPVWVNITPGNPEEIKIIID